MIKFSRFSLIVGCLVSLRCQAHDSLRLTSDDVDSLPNANTKTLLATANSATNDLAAARSQSIIDHRETQEIGLSCFKDWVEEMGLDEEFCEPVPDSGVGDFVQLIKEDVLPALKVVGSVLNPKLEAELGSDSCRCQFGMEIKVEKLVQRILKSRANPCYTEGDRGSGKFSRKKVRANGKVLHSFERVLKNIGRIPVIKVYANRLRPAARTISKRYRDVTDRVVEKCQDFNRRAIDATDQAVKVMNQMRTAHQFATNYTKQALDLACLVQGSERATRNRRALHRMHKMRWQTRRRLQGGDGMNSSSIADHATKRLLAFNPDMIDISGLGQVLSAAAETSSTLCGLSDQFDEIISNVEVSFESLDSALGPIVAFGDFIEDIISPVVSVIREITNALSFLRCPSWLGFLCDLDSLLVGIVDTILSAAGFSIDDIISSIVGDVLDSIGVPSPEFFDSFFEIPLDLSLTPVFSVFGDMVRNIEINPFANAFDESGRADTTVPGGVDIEFRLATGDDTVTVTCADGEGLLPVVLDASSSTSCQPGYDFTSQVRYPCDEFCFGCNPQCTVDPVVDGGVAPCDSTGGPFEFLGDAQLQLRRTNVLYTCLTEEQFQNLDTLPYLLSTAFSVGQTDVPNFTVAFDACVGDTTVQVVGSEHFRYKYAETRYPIDSRLAPYFYGRKLPCNGLTPSINDLLLDFERECNGHVGSCSVRVPERCHSDEDYLNFLRAKYICTPRDEMLADVSGLEIKKSYSVSDCRHSGHKAVSVSTDSNPMTVEETYEFVGSGRRQLPRGFSVPVNKELRPGDSSPVNMDPYEPDIGFHGRGDVYMECPQPDKVIRVLEVQSGKGGILDPTLSDETNAFKLACDGLQTCSTSTQCPGDYSGYRILQAEYECICPEGYMPLPDSATEQCTPCGAGWYRSTGMDVCEACPAGSFSEDEAAARCRKCESGTYSTTAGQTSCFDCPAGTYSHSWGAGAAESCVDCEQNSWSPSGSSYCLPCNAGEKTVEPGSPFCTLVEPGEFNYGSWPRDGPQDCPPGTFSTFEGATECDLCPRGTFARGSGNVGCGGCSDFSMGACDLCPPGTYADQEGSSQCTPCNHGGYTDTVGAQSADDCIAPSIDIDYNDRMFQNYTLEELLMLDFNPGLKGTIEYDMILERRLQQIENGICNFGPWNTIQGNWDGGDCCRQSCTPLEIDEEIIDQFVSEFTCLPDMFSSCYDPEYTHLPDIDCSASRRNLEVADLYADSRLGDGVCDADLNTDPVFDGGDCCQSTCRYNPSFPFQSCSSFTECLGIPQNMVSIREIQEPILVCPGLVRRVTEPGLCSAPLPGTDIALQSGEVCGVVSWGYRNPPASLQLGDNALTYEANVPSSLLGNPSCDVIMHVEDNENPTITCPAQISTCSAEIPEILPEAEDNCGDVFVTSKALDGDTLVVGSNELEFQATDASGNTATCTWTIQVLDPSSSECAPSTFTCPAPGDATYGNKPTLDGLNDEACGATDTYLFTAMYKDLSGCISYCASCEPDVCGYSDDGGVTCSDPSKCKVCYDGCDSNEVVSPDPVVCSPFEGGHLTCEPGTADPVNVEFERQGACNSVDSQWRDCNDTQNRDSCLIACSALELGKGCCSFRAHLASGNNGIDSSTGKYGCLYYPESNKLIYDGNVDIFGSLCSAAVPEAVVGCFTSPTSDPIEDCSCHSSCGACGFYDNPVNADDCITCADGSSVTPFYSDGTGVCGATVPEGAVGCFISPFTDPIENCTCHPSCGTCGFYDNPVGADDCVTCADGSSVTPVYSDGTGICGVH